MRFKIAELRGAFKSRARTRRATIEMTRASEFAFVFEFHRAAPATPLVIGDLRARMGKQGEKEKKKKENQTAGTLPAQVSAE